MTDLHVDGEVAVKRITCAVARYSRELHGEPLSKHGICDVKPEPNGV
jgi:hypothetical protein